MRVRRGLTLLELMIAMAVGGMVLLGARELLEATSNVASELVRAVQTNDRAANGNQLLHDLFARLEVGTPWAHDFGGDPREVRFSTWCAAPDGRLVPCDADLAFEAHANVTTLVVHVVPRNSHISLSPTRIVLDEKVASGEFRYLNDPAAGGQWFTHWGAAIVTPVAVGLIIDQDTTILRIRG